MPRHSCDIECWQYCASFSERANHKLHPKDIGYHAKKTPQCHWIPLMTLLASLMVQGQGHLDSNICSQRMISILTACRKEATANRPSQLSTLFIWRAQLQLYLTTLPQAVTRNIPVCTVVFRTKILYVHGFESVRIIFSRGEIHTNTGNNLRKFGQKDTSMKLPCVHARTGVHLYPCIKHAYAQRCVYLPFNVFPCRLLQGNYPLGYSLQGGAVGGGCSGWG